MSEHPIRSRLNPTVVKGAAYSAAGLSVLVAPGAARPVLQFLLAGTLLAVAAGNLWGHVRVRDSAHGRARAFLALVAVIGILAVPREAMRTVELIMAAYMAALGLLALRRGMGQGRGEGPRTDIGRGLMLIAGALVIFVLPSVMVSLAVVVISVAAVLLGTGMMAWGFRLGLDSPEVAGRGLVLEIFHHWLADRDLGPERRQVIADTLYFEEPDRRLKIASYVTMLVLSVAIASLAVLQDSTAVVIGAMLIAPLMTPIMGVAAGLVAGWRSRVVASLAVVAASVASAIGLAWVLASWIPDLVPLEANSQVLSRASPTLLDMAVALVAGAAGAYATVNERVSQSLTGVAIAVALVPPLSVVGVALEAGQLQAAGGAFLLFATNLVSIIVASMVVFVLVGFSRVGKIIDGRRSIADLMSLVAVAAILIMVPLGLSGRSVIEASQRTGRVQRQVTEWLGPDSTLRVDRVRTRPGEAIVLLSGSGEVPKIAALERALQQNLGRHMSVTVEYVPSKILTAADQDREADPPAAAESEDSPVSFEPPAPNEGPGESEGPPTTPDVQAREESGR